MASLMEFHKDVETRDNVHEYLVEYLKGEVIKRAFEHEDVRTLAQAKDVIDKAFENLDNMFKSKKEVTKTINEAR